MNAAFNQPKRLIIASIIILLAGCAAAPQQSDGPAKTTAPDATLNFIVSGDTSGFIVPCGCTSKQFGGMPRRATYLQQSGKNASLIYLDAGGNIARATDYDAIKLNFIWQG